MQMPSFFERRIVVISGGGLDSSAPSRAAMLPTSAAEAPQAPANSKSRRFACIGTSSKYAWRWLQRAERRADASRPTSRTIPRQQNIGCDSVAAFRHSVLVFDRFGSRPEVSDQASLVRFSFTSRRAPRHAGGGVGP